MGNHKFRLSDMIPNAWFYKLKDMSPHKGNKKPSLKNMKTLPSRTSSRSSSSITARPFPPPQTQLLPNRASYYFSTRPDQIEKHSKYSTFSIEPPRKSKKRSRKKPITTSSLPAGCSCRARKPFPPLSLDSRPCPRDYYIDGEEPEFFLKTDTQSCSCTITASATDNIIAVAAAESSPPAKPSPEKVEDVEAASELELPPILTKPAKFMDQNDSQRKSSSPPAAGLHRLRLRPNSPRLAVRGRRSTSLSATATTKQHQQQQKQKQKKSDRLSESFAVVKSSSDPQKDFRESMMEMIVENDMRTSKDLEDLLACYLLLNSNEYHDLIVKVFEQIWFDLTNLKL